MFSQSGLGGEQGGCSDPAQLPVDTLTPTQCPPRLTVSWEHLSATIAIFRAAEQGFSGTGGRKCWVTPHSWPQGWQGQGDKSAGHGEVQRQTEIEAG